MPVLSLPTWGASQVAENIPRTGRPSMMASSASSSKIAESISAASSRNAIMAYTVSLTIARGRVQRWIGLDCDSKCTPLSKGMRSCLE